MELVYDDKTGTWGEAPEAYGTIECATKEDYEYAKKAIKGYKELEAKHWDECRQIAHYDDELKEAKRLLKAAIEDVETLAKAFAEDEPCGSFTLCTELNLAILKLKRGWSEKRQKNIVEEIADVLIMVLQLRYIFGADKVDEVITQKLVRQLERIEEEQSHDN